MAIDEELIRESEDEGDRLTSLFDTVEEFIIKAFTIAISTNIFLKGINKAKSDSLNIINDLRGETKKWLSEVMPKIYFSGVQFADKQIKKAGGKLVDLGELHSIAVQIASDSIYNRLEQQFFTVGRRVEDIYRNLALEHIKQVSIGNKSWQQGSRNYLNDLLKNGITGFRDSAGRQWNMKTYTKIVIRTGVMETHLNATANRFVENKYDLIKISKHSNPCELCKPWEGEILSLTGKTEGYKTLDYAKSKGLFHVNCLHAYGAYLPELDN